MEKALKGGQFLTFIELSALVPEWFGGYQLRHKPKHQKPGGGRLHTGEPAEQDEHPGL